MPKHRYNSMIQRAKGLLEIAAGMYDSSLSFQTTRAAEKVLQTAVDSGFIYLPIEGELLRRLAKMGYRVSVVSKSRLKGMARGVPTVDFSGWPMAVHADLPNDIAYAICEAIEKRRAALPSDNFKPIRLRQLCANDGEAPFNVPLHPGARRFYRERGCLT